MNILLLLHIEAVKAQMYSYTRLMKQLQNVWFFVKLNLLTRVLTLGISRPKKVR